MVVYDTTGINASTRLYWTFQYFGHKGHLSILNGGFDGWIKSGGEVSSGVETFEVI